MSRQLLTEDVPAGRRPRTGLATIAVTLGLYGVLGYALSGQPTGQLPPAVAKMVATFPSIIPAVNSMALVCLLAGWRAARVGRIDTHRKYMLASAALISIFLALYVTRVALTGTKAFPGPPAVRIYIYLPALSIHVLLSILSVPMVVYNLITGLTRSIRDIGTTRHPQIGRDAVALWSTSLVLGIVVYLLLNIVY